MRDKLEALLDYKNEYLGYKYIIWGTGNTAALYQEGLDRISEILPIYGYVDNNPKKWDKYFCGKPVYSPEYIIELNKEEKILILIASPQPNVIKSVSVQLDEAGICYCYIDEIIFKLLKNNVLKCYDLLEDDKSRRVYYEIVKCRVSGCYPPEDIIDSNQYFGIPMFARANEVFVDCGAYVGDSFEQYIWKTEGTFKKYIAFEPDESNLKAMNERVLRLKKEWNISDERIEIYPYGVSSADSVKAFESYGANNGFGSKFVDSSNDGDGIKIVKLDSCINEKVDFIKADIESYEYQMLLGAQEIIKRDHPKLAICIYHNAIDFCTIPLLIKEMFSEYKFKLRHYTDLLSESVLYAYLGE